jgi:hypothetical protein
MRKTTLLAVVGGVTLAVLLALGVPKAQADVGISIGIPIPGITFYAPAPPVYYSAPPYYPRAYYAPPVYYGPSYGTVYYGRGYGRGYGGGWGRHHGSHGGGHRQGHGHGHRGHRW